MKTAEFKGNTWGCGLAAFCMAVMMLLFLVACNSDDAPKKQYIHRISLTHPDGTVENWMLREGFETEDGFVKWTTANGGTMRISGSITITPIVITPPKPIEPKPEFKDGDMP